MSSQNQILFCLMSLHNLTHQHEFIQLSLSFTGLEWILAGSQYLFSYYCL